MFNIRKIKNTDLILVTTMIILMIIGAMNIFATTYYPDREISREFYSQLAFYLIGSVLALFVSTFDFRKLKNRYLQFLIYLITILSLVLVLLIGTTRYGATRWIELGAFLFQPSELAKVSVIIIISYIFASEKGIKLAKDKATLKKRIQFLRENKKKTRLLLARTLEYVILKTLRRSVIAFFVWVSFAALIIQQHSLGNTLLLTGISFIIYVYAYNFSWKNAGYLIAVFIGILVNFGLFKIDYRPEAVFQVFDLSLHVPTVILAILCVLIFTNIFRASYIKSILIFFVFTLTSIIVSYSLTNLVEPYQRVRLESFINAESQELDQTSNWNRKQSLIACGSGKIVGKGFASGTQSNYKFLPFSYTDFAYCGYVEQFGFIGSILLVGVYIVLLHRILSFSERVRDTFGSYILIGVFALILLNMFQHIGMNIGILPITGVPLPIVSYGGTSVILTFLSIGLVQSVLNFSEQRRKVVKIEPKAQKRGSK